MKYRIFCIMMILSFSISILTSCSKDDTASDTTSSTAETKSVSASETNPITESETSAFLDVSFENAYTYETVMLNNMSAYTDIQKAGDYLLISGYDENHDDIYLLFNTVNNTVQEFSPAYSASLSQTAEYYICACFADTENHLVFVYNAYDWDIDNAENPYQDLGYTMEVYDTDMHLLETKGLHQLLNDGEYIQDICMHDNGNYYITIHTTANTQQVFIYDKDFVQLDNIQGDYISVQNLCIDSDGQVNIVYQDHEWNTHYGIVNPETNSIEEADISAVYDTVVNGGQDYDFYYHNAFAVYGISLQESAAEKVIDWTNSDLIGDEIADIIELDNHRFAVMRSPEENEDTVRLLILQKQDEHAFDTIQMISLSAVYLSKDLAKAVCAFNQTNTEYRICIADYNKFCTDGNLSSGAMQLETDMQAGITADIICLDGLDGELLANDNLLADISCYIDALNDTDYFMNFLQALAYEDKLCRFGFSFSVQTMEAKTAYLKGKNRFSSEEFIQWTANLPATMDAFGMDMTQESVWTLLFGDQMNSFIDPQTKTCYFDTPAFSEWLEWIAAYPQSLDSVYDAFSDEDWLTYWNEITYQYMDGKALLYPVSITSVKAAFSERFSVFDYSDVTFVGYPTVQENSNGSLFIPACTLAVAENSLMKEQAWAFLESTLSETFQENLSYALPVSKEAFDKKAQEALLPDTYTDENGDTIYLPYTINRGEEIIEAVLPTQEDIDSLKNMIAAITETAYYNEQVYEILWEEANCFFSGEQTAKEAAAHIQSRVTDYFAQ